MATPFAPLDNATVNIDVSGSTQRVLVSSFGAAQQVRIKNDGTATVWLRAGGVGVNATTSDMPVGAGVTEVLTFAPGEDVPLYIAAIAAGGTGKIYFTPGGGI